MSMPSLLHLQKEGVLEKHQLEGNDPSTRSFNRTVVIARTAKRYIASTIYEDLKVQSDPHSTVAAAIENLVHRLHEFGVYEHANTLKLSRKTVPRGEGTMG